MAVTTHVFRDAWPVFHVWLAWLLLSRRNHIRALGPQAWVTPTALRHGAFDKRLMMDG